MCARKELLWRDVLLATAKMFRLQAGAPEEMNSLRKNVFVLTAIQNSKSKYLELFFRIFFEYEYKRKPMKEDEIDKLKNSLQNRWIS